MAAVDRVLPWRRHQNVTADELTPLLSAYRRRHPKAPVAMINRAYETAKEAHRHQSRGSGESYINHPLAVARIVADIGLDEISLAAALLHDAVEDTEITIADVEAGVRCRGRCDRRRRHQARAAAVRLEGGAAGRDDAQDAGGDGTRPARAHHQARRPPAQHANHRGDAQREAAAHRPGDARHLRPAGPPAGDAGAQAAARRPLVRVVVSQTIRRARSPRQHAHARARGLSGQGHCRGRRPVARPQHRRRGHRPREAPVEHLREDDAEGPRVRRHLRPRRDPRHRRQR